MDFCLLQKTRSAKKSTVDAIKTTWKREIRKTTEAIGDLIGIKIADKITIVSKKSSHNNFDGANTEIKMRKER